MAKNETGRRHFPKPIFLKEGIHMMKHQRGDAGASMLTIMVVLALGYWLFSSHDGGRGGGGGGHHMMGGHGGTHAEQSTPEKTGPDDNPRKEKR